MPQLNFDHQSAFFFKWQWLGHFAKHLAGGRPGHRTRAGYVAAGHSGGLNNRSTACARPEFFCCEKTSNPARSWILVSLARPSKPATAPVIPAKAGIRRFYICVAVFSALRSFPPSPPWGRGPRLPPGRQVMPPSLSPKGERGAMLKLEIPAFAGMSGGSGGSPFQMTPAPGAVS